MISTWPSSPPPPRWVVTLTAVSENGRLVSAYSPAPWIRAA